MMVWWIMSPCSANPPIHEAITTHQDLPIQCPDLLSLLYPAGTTILARLSRSPCTTEHVPYPFQEHPVQPCKLFRKPFVQTQVEQKWRQHRSGGRGKAAPTRCQSRLRAS